MVTMEIFEKYYSEMVRFDRSLGMNLSVHEPGKASYTMDIMEQHLTSPDQCHGGVISALMDAVLGVSSLSLAVSRDNFCTTLEFKINYISTAKPGDSLKATAEIDSCGSKIITASGSIKEVKSGRLIARGMGTFMQFPLSKKKDILTPVED